MVPQGPAFAERKTRCYKDALQLETQLLSGKRKVRSYQNALRLRETHLLSGHRKTVVMGCPAVALLATRKTRCRKMLVSEMGTFTSIHDLSRMGRVGAERMGATFDAHDDTVTEEQHNSISAKWRDTVVTFFNRDSRNPCSRKRPQWLLAKMLVYETGKPLAEAKGEIDYATSLTWWFVGEAERAPGTSVVSAVPGRRRHHHQATHRRRGRPRPLNTPSVAEALCLHPLVKKITFTGSTRVGKLITTLCARNLKPYTLELGGNCPFIVFRRRQCSWLSSGDMPARPASPPTGSTSSEASTTPFGTTIGPVTTPRGLHKAEHMARDATSKGATMVLGRGFGHGADSASGTGYFMHLTILTGGTDEMLISQDEIFAPLLGVSVFDTEDEVTRRANDKGMKLAIYVFTKNVDRVWRMFERLEAGMMGSCAEAPFGGIKESGCGKEGGKDVAVEEFLVTENGTLTVEDHW
ncbi:hypothetical protein E4U54_006919 [Claviceps lovelessii]|nr:hypothetical protein E4U54_006919 [Claviceps lovelessii]